MEEFVDAGELGEMIREGQLVMMTTVATLAFTTRD